MMRLYFSLIRCPVCRRQASSALGCCQTCAGSMFQIMRDETLTLGVYEGRLENAVRALEFHGVTRLADLFGRQLAEAALLEARPLDFVCAVPLHSRRRLQRGYNQSALIARAAARQLGLPYRPLLQRTRATRQQALLPPAERQDNVAGAFLARPIDGGRILLVDDVLTTGATTTECSLALLAAGAAHVRVAVVARAGAPTGDEVEPANP